jgi:phosphoenolpyruvate synthase/pyruvate phosphate dikinase
MRRGSFTISGIAASPGRYKGRARLITDVRDIPRVKRGEILVTPFTQPQIVLALARVGAIVTDHGGRFAHAAVVAREFGVPAVVGAGDATERIPDGALVMVDGLSGTVEVY